MRISFFALLVGMFFYTTPVFALLQAGERAPDFTVRNLAGDTVRLSDFKGQRLLIEMGTTWCPSCKALAHQLDGLRGELREKKVTHLVVFLNDSVDSVSTYFEKAKLQKPDHILIDEDAARIAYGVFTIPRLILIAPDFTIVFDEMNGDVRGLKKQLDL